MNKTIEERANSTTNWILRREGCLKAAHLPTVLVGELQEQRKIDIEKACDAYCKEVCKSEQTSGKRCYWRVQNERCQKLKSFVKAIED